MDLKNRIAREEGRAGEPHPQSRAAFLVYASLGLLGATTMSGQAVPGKLCPSTVLSQ